MILQVLAFIGAFKGRGVAALIVLAMATPALGAVMRPFVGPAVIALLTLAFVRINLRAARGVLREPRVLAAAVAWTAIGVPVVMILIVQSSGLAAWSPGLAAALTLQALAAPLMAGPAFAALLGLEPTRVLLLLIAGTLATPFAAPLVAALVGFDLGLSPYHLLWQLTWILTLAGGVGLGFRAWATPEWIAQQSQALDGINMLVMFIFLSAVMGDLGVQLLADPIRVLRITVLAFGVFWTLFWITRALFGLFGKAIAQEVALTVCNRNMGLMVAATGVVFAADGWIYFAAVQFPIYLTPLLLAPLIRLDA